uniref:Golgin IMH1-like isoform X1 n=1 Tax=Dermatophagoides pteronyssinus TaxID=6956 RepID=A0A6P6XZ24_DERPT|nr:golgin IMH1-like isoform X1 [Dermatophagoides pteronyssinus]
MAKEAYKAEKFRQRYEKELIRAVYDHEVDVQDKLYFTNAPKQTSEKGVAQSMKKQEIAKIPKKDLKKIKKKINSQIEAKSKNDPSFWDDYNKDPEQYKQPTGFKTKAKKYFKSLWPFSKGNSEEQLKSEELVRFEARRQYENIRKNRLELDKISTGYESTIEEIKDDPLLAKMIPILNQEHADIYRETIKTTNIPESGKKDQLKEWTKNFKDNRNKFRNEFDKKFEMTFGEESDNKLIKKGNLLKSSTHGSKTTEDESTKILRSDSDKDKKTQTPVSMIRRTESTSKPKGSQTTEILSSDSSQDEKPSNLGLIDEQQSTDNVKVYQNKDSENQLSEIERKKAELRKIHAIELEEWAKKYKIRENRYNETGSEADLIILNRMLKNKPKLPFDDDDEIVGMTKPQRPDSQTSEQYEKKVKKPQTDNNVGAYAKKDSENQLSEIDRKKAELRKIHEIELEEWAKKCKIQENRYNETGSEADLNTLQRLQKNKPKFLFDDDDDDEIVSMTKPQNSEMKHRKSTDSLSEFLENERKINRAEMKREHRIKTKEWLQKYKAQKFRWFATGSDEDMRILEQLIENKPTLHLDDDDDDEVISMTKSLRPEMKRPNSSQIKETSSFSSQDEQSTSNKLDKKISTNQESTNIPTTTTNEISEPERKIPLYSEIAEKIYENGIRYEYYDLKDKKGEIYQYWETRLDKIDYLLEHDADRAEAKKMGIEYGHCLACEYERSEIQQFEELKEMDKKIKNAKDFMENDLKSKQKIINKQIDQFGKDENKRKNTENEIKKEIFDKYKEQIEEIKSTKAPEDEQKAKSGIEKKIRKIFKFGNENDVDLEPLEYRIEPILTDEEKLIVSQAIERSSEKKQYRSSILKEMLEFERLVKIDKGKTQEAILFRDEHFKPLYQEIVDGNFENDIYKFGLLLDGTDRYYIEKSIIDSKSEHKYYRAQIMNQINYFAANIDLSESDRETLTDFFDIFRKRVRGTDESIMPEYPISNFRRNVVPGPNPVLSAEQEDFLYYESMIKPKIYNKPVDYYVWYFKELYGIKGENFYDPSHVRFYTLDKEKTNSFLMSLLIESFNNSQFRKAMKYPLVPVTLNMLDETPVTYEEKYSRYSGLPRSSSSSTASQPSETDSFTKRVQRSVNLALLQTITEMQENPFTDYSQKL